MIGQVTLCVVTGLCSPPCWYGFGCSEMFQTWTRAGPCPGTVGERCVRVAVLPCGGRPSAVSSVQGLALFLPLAVWSSAAVNLFVTVLELLLSVLLGICLKTDLLDCIILCLTFRVVMDKLFSTVATLFHSL